MPRGFESHPLRFIIVLRRGARVVYQARLESACRLTATVGSNPTLSANQVKSKMKLIRRKPQKIGLALSGGAARGLAHIGVLKALEEQAVPINMITGTSTGSVIGAYFAKEGEIAGLEEIALGVEWRQLTHLLDPNLVLLRKGFIQGQRIEELLFSIIGDVEFKDLKIPFAVVATDVSTSEEIVITEGSVIRAVRASISLPVIFTPVKFKGRFLADGGIVNPVPVDVLKNMGASFIIAVNVNPKPQKRSAASLSKKRETPEEISNPQIKSARLSAFNEKLDKLVQDSKDRFKLFEKFSDIVEAKIYQGKHRIEPDTPNIFDVLVQSIYAMEYEIAKSKMKGADVIISPDVSHIAPFEFHRGKEAILIGYEATRGILPQLQQMARGK